MLIVFYLNGQAPHAIGIVQCLAGLAGQDAREGLTARQLTDRLAEYGLLQPGANEHNSLANLLQRLLQIGVVDHPAVPGGTWRYTLRTVPEFGLAA